MYIDIDKCLFRFTVRGGPKMTSRLSGGVLFTLSMLLIFCASSLAAPFPLNFTLDSLAKADAQPKAFDGRSIAFKGTVTLMNELPDGKLYFFVQFPAPNPKNLGLWVASYVDAKPGDIKVGHNIVVLGNFALVQADDKAVVAINKKAYQAIGYCIANGTTQMGLYAKDGTNRCTEWQNGRIPTAIPDVSNVPAVKTPAQKKP